MNLMLNPHYVTLNMNQGLKIFLYPFVVFRWV